MYNRARGCLADMIAPSVVYKGSMDNDLALVHAFKAGDQPSFDALVTKYKDRIYRMAFGMLHDSNEADDITQEVFLKVYLKIKSFKESSSFFTWLYRIAVNECLNGLRKKKRLPLSLDAPLADDNPEIFGATLLSPERDIEAQLISTEQAALLHTLIDALPEKYKAAYVLRMMADFSYREIAEILQLPEQTVKIRLFRAREKMDEKIKTLGGVNNEL
jgi:RNA polymerase sigma-70 factor (ECF subfamily)